LRSAYPESLPTCIQTIADGGGFLTDHFPNAAKAIWHFDGIYASSRHIPGVRFAGIIHPVRIVAALPWKHLCFLFLAPLQRT